MCFIAADLSGSGRAWRSSQRKRHQVIEPSGDPHQSAPSRAKNASRSSEPVPSGSYPFLSIQNRTSGENGLNICEAMRDDTHQISCRGSGCDPSPDLTQIACITRPSSLASSPGSGPGPVCADAGDPRIVSMSMDRPRHPAFWHFAGVGVDGGGFGVFGACARTFVAKSVSWRARS